MSLISLEHVVKRYSRRGVERTALNDVSLEIEAGERIAILGPRRSGRSTLLRVIAGVELPDEGRVCFEGHDLARSRNRVLGSSIGFCQTGVSPGERALVIDSVASGLLAQRTSLKVARRRAEALLAEVGAEQCGPYELYELDGAELARVAIARAMITAPALLVFDEPTVGVELVERDRILALLRSISDQGTAVLTSTADSMGLSSVDRALSIDAGVVRGDLAPAAGDVIPLRAHASPSHSRDAANDG